MPAFVAIASPYGFTRSALNRQRLPAIAFLAIPLINIAVFAGQHFMLFSAAAELLELSSDRARISKLLDLPVNAPSADKRALAARIIFEQYGVRVPYRSESGDFRLLEPSAKDRQEYAAWQEAQKAAGAEQQALRRSYRHVLASAGFQLAAFLVVVIAGLLRAGGRASAAPP